MTTGRREDPERPTADPDRFINRFLIVGCGISMLAALLHALALAFGPPDAADGVFLILDLVAAILLGSAYLFRHQLGMGIRVLAVVVVVGGLAVLALTRSGFLGAGILLLCTLIVVSLSSLRTRTAGAVAGLCVAVPLTLSIPVGTGHLQFDPELIHRQNHPVGWIFTALLLGLFATVSWTVITHLRHRLLSEIAALERSRDALQSTNRALEASRDRVTRMAYYDDLTGLPNRPNLDEYVSQRINDGLAQGHLLLMDIRAFRVVNVMLGSAGADAVLQDVANALRDHQNGHRFAARISGDEFALWVEDHSDHTLQETLDPSLRRHMASLPVERASHRVQYATAAACYPDDGRTFEECLHKAGIALRQAKQSRADSLCLFQSGMMEQMRASLHMRHLLEQAIEQRQFFMAYQPKVRIRDEEITGVEALARWSPASLGPVSPSDFIPEITAANLMVPFGRLIVETVLADMPAIRRRYGNVPVAINISPLFFFSRGFAEFVIQRARAHDVDPSMLVLEITEDILLANIELTHEVIGTLKSSGVRMSLDDFGKGYSSLHYLSYLPLEELKLDKAFVDHICDDERSLALLQYACAMATTLGFQVVAEGVESRAQVRLLRDTECSYAQGYLFGRPEALEPRFRHPGRGANSRAQ